MSSRRGDELFSCAMVSFWVGGGLVRYRRSCWGRGKWVGAE